MLAYCVNHLSSLKARLVSEHFGRNKSKIETGGHMTELRQTFQRKILLQNIFITKDKCRLSIKICLKSADTWALTLFYSVVIVSLPVS